MNSSQLITGIVLIVVGLLMMVGFFNGKQYVGIIAGIFFFIMGIVILCNQEDKIEEIKRK